jgi:hypothetical protein
LIRSKWRGKQLDVAILGGCTTVVNGLGSTRPTG